MSHGNNQSTHPVGKPGRTVVFFRRIRHRITSTRARVPVLWWRHLGLKPEDVFLGCYPRSGSTWLRFTLFEILTGKPSSFDSVNAAFRGPGDRLRGWPLLPGQGRFLGTHELYRPSYRKAFTWFAMFAMWPSPNSLLKKTWVSVPNSLTTTWKTCSIKERDMAAGRIM